MTKEKQYITRIYASDGTTLQKVLTSERPDDLTLPYVKNIPTFRARINGGYGECELDLSYPFDNFNEGTVVKAMNVVTITAVVTDLDAKTQTETLIYKGFMSQIEPYINAGEEGVRVTCLGLVSIPSFIYYKNGSSYTVSHSSDDPETIGRAIVDYVNSIYTDSLLSYSGDTTDPTGTTVTIDFEDTKCFDALKETGELTPAGWWWMIDRTGQYWLKDKPSSATHSLTIGKDIVSLTAPKNSEKVVNDVQVRRTGGSTSDYSDSTSISTFGKRSKIITDSDIGNLATADERGEKEVNDNKDEKISATVVVDSNYDIESIKIGDTCKVRNFRKANTFFSSNMQIIGLTYLGDTVRLELEQNNADFGLELSNFVG